jgi:hypothetical protein
MDQTPEPSLLEAFRAAMDESGVSDDYPPEALEWLYDDLLAAQAFVRTSQGAGALGVSASDPVAFEQRLALAEALGRYRDRVPPPKKPRRPRDPNEPVAAIASDPLVRLSPAPRYRAPASGPVGRSAPPPWSRPAKRPTTTRYRRRGPLTFGASPSTGGAGAARGPGRPLREQSGVGRAFVFTSGARTDRAVSPLTLPPPLSLRMSPGAGKRPSWPVLQSRHGRGTEDADG